MDAAALAFDCEDWMHDRQSCSGKIDPAAIAATQLSRVLLGALDAAHAACGVPPEFMLLGAEREKPLPCPDCEERRRARIREADWFAQRLLGTLAISRGDHRK